MLRSVVTIGVAGGLGLAACAPLPNAPSVASFPPSGKTLEAFQADDFGCRHYADQSVNGESASGAAAQSGIGSAAVGTALGAAAGALLGSVGGMVGAGAAIGAGGGLLLGSAIGAGNADAAGGGVQFRYDTAYQQCMFSKGNTVSRGPATGYAVASPPYSYYGPSYYAPSYYGY